MLKPPKRHGDDMIDAPTSRGGPISRSSLGFVSASYGKERKPKHFSEEFSRRYRVKTHRETSPDYRYSQPRAEGDRYTLKQVQWCFDETHPAVAGQHFARTELHVSTADAPFVIQ